MTLGEVYPFVDGASPCGRAAKRAGRGRERFMAERKRKQKKGFSALAVRIGLVCVCIYLCVSLVFAQIDIVSKRQQLENLTQQVAAQEAANTELQRTLDSGDYGAHRARQAGICAARRAYLCGYVGGLTAPVLVSIAASQFL